MNALTPLTAPARGSFRQPCDTARAIGKASDSAPLRQDQQVFNVAADRAPQAIAALLHLAAFAEDANDVEASLGLLQALPDYLSAGGAEPHHGHGHTA